MKRLCQAAKQEDTVAELGLQRFGCAFQLTELNAEPFALPENIAQIQGSLTSYDQPSRNLVIRQEAYNKIEFAGITYIQIHDSFGLVTGEP